MINELGFGALVLAFVVSFYGIFAATLGLKNTSPIWIESARRAMLATFPLSTISLLCLGALLASGDFRTQYVYNVTSQSMPLYLKITALWGGQSGSLLFWSWLMSGFAAAIALRNWNREKEFLPWVIIVILFTQVFFLGLKVFIENPFDRFWIDIQGNEITSVFAPNRTIPIIPFDGRGLNPLLRHPGMVLHPPALYLGFVSYIVPFAFAFASLATGQSDERWLRITRRWALVAWLFLSLGLLLGSRWAYDVLGWGGYWAWDPVEIAALMPWLTGTAFLHSAIIQERRGIFKRWNILLIILTYCLVIFGTFLTRSGVLSSVHAFSQSAIGPLFFGFIGITFLTTLGLVLQKWNDLRVEGQITSVWSRESLFLFNNLLFMGILAVCFWGVLFPLISELFTGQKITVGPPFYEQSAGPLFGALILLMGIAPLSAWGYASLRKLGKSLWKPLAVSIMMPVIALAQGINNFSAIVVLWFCAIALCVTFYDYGRGILARQRSTAEPLFTAFWNLTIRNRRRYGGYIIHAGVVLIALGIIGIEFFQKETHVTLDKGQNITFRGYTLNFASLSEFDSEEGLNTAVATFSIENNGHKIGSLFPRRDYYYDYGQPVTVPGVYSTLMSDLYVILVDWEPISSTRATFKIFHNPLVNWLWIGGLIFILGTMIACWPDNDTDQETIRFGRRMADFNTPTRPRLSTLSDPAHGLPATKRQAADMPQAIEHRRRRTDE